MFPPPELDEYGRPRLISPVVGMSRMSPPPQIPEPPAQTSLPQYSQPPQMPSPVAVATGDPFAPIHAQPATPGPYQQQILNRAAPPDINDPQYKNSRLRTVLNAIAGGLAGAAGGPEAGVKVGAGLRDAKFNRAQEAYDRQTEDLKLKAGIEKEQQTRGEKEVTETTQRGTAILSGEKKQSDAALGEKKLDLATKEQASKDKHRLELGKYTEWKMNNPKLDDLQYFMSLPDEDVPAAIAMMKKVNETKGNTPEAKGAIKAAQTQADINTKSLPENLRKEQQITAATGAGSAGGRIAGESTPAALKGTEQHAGAQAKGSGEAKTTPEMIKRDADLTRAKSFATLTTNEKDTIRGSQVALQAFPDIREQLVNASDKIFGNRWNDFMVGTLGKDPEFVPLRTNIGMLQTLVAKLHVGSRGSVHILNHFVDLFNAKQMDREDLSTSLDTLEKWLVRYSKAPAGTQVTDVPDEVPENVLEGGHTYEVIKK
jgi:hypothetical protein